MTIPALEVRRSADRFTTRTSWLHSRHSFSFGSHFDPADTHHGLLVVNNEDVVEPGTGFDTHPHRDMEIVTWVLRGSLVHQDSTGRNGVVYPGLAQRMSAGTGILHSERNDSWRLTGDRHDDPVHFVQMWVVPEEPGIEPGYDQREVEADLLPGALIPVASGRPGHDSAIRIRNRLATLHAARLDRGQSVVLPDAPYLHLFVARGSVSVEAAGVLVAGDAARITGAGGQRVRAVDPSEVLVWEMRASVRG